MFLIEQGGVFFFYDSIIITFEGVLLFINFVYNYMIFELCFEVVYCCIIIYVEGEDRFDWFFFVVSVVLRDVDASTTSLDRRFDFYVLERDESVVKSAKPWLGRWHGDVVVSSYGAPDTARTRDHDLDLVARHEPQVIDGVDVGRIGHRDDEGRARVVDRYAAVVLRLLLGDKFEHSIGDLELIQIDRWHTVGVADEAGDFVLAKETSLDELLAEESLALCDRCEIGS